MCGVREGWRDKKLTKVAEMSGDSGERVGGVGAG